MLHSQLRRTLLRPSPSPPLSRLLSSEPAEQVKLVQKSGMNIRLPGGVPDFVEKWNPGNYYKVGYGLSALSALSLPTIAYDAVSIHPGKPTEPRPPCSHMLVAFVHTRVCTHAPLVHTSSPTRVESHTCENPPVLPLTIASFTAVYWKVGLSDLAQKNHSLRRNFPFLCHVRYLFESIRPEIQQ